MLSHYPNCPHFGSLASYYDINHISTKYKVNIIPADAMTTTAGIILNPQYIIYIKI